MALAVIKNERKVATQHVYERITVLLVLRKSSIEVSTDDVEYGCVNM